MTSDDRWDVPNPKLARIASAEPSPQFRDCTHCKHRHPKGELCGHFFRLIGDGTTCRCRQ